MREVLFSHSYFLRFDPKQWQIAQPYAPLGTLYAAAVLRREGYAVRLLDVMFAETPMVLAGELEKSVPDYFVLWDDGFNYLTKMCLTNMREAAFHMIAQAKTAGCTVIVCSSDATDQHVEYLKQGADFILLGEGEQTLVELTRALEQDKPDLINIPGLAYLPEGTVHKTAPRAVLRDLDTLPQPAWDLVDLAPYRQMWQKSNGYFSINMSTTRGCPFKCNWCAKPIYGNRYHSHAAERIVEELQDLQQKYGFAHVWFCDDIFGLRPGWIRAFADAVEKANLRFRFKIQSRVDILLQEDNIRDLARAGCDTIWMGAESGSQKILDAMDKGTKVEQIYEATQLLKKHGIHPAFFIQFGYPGETAADIELTIKMINTLLPHEIGISVSYPLPGTAFYERVKQELIHKANWTDSDDLALMFTNTYPPAFYKQLHRYVHQSYRAHLAAAHWRQFWAKPFQDTVMKLRKVAGGLSVLPGNWLLRRQLRQWEKTLLR